MLTKKERVIHRALDLQREIVKAKLSRRELLKLGLATGVGGALGSQGAWLSSARGAGMLPSPPTDPWLEPLPIPAVLEPVSSLGGPDYDPAAHQFCSNRFPPKKLYRMRAQERKHSFHPQLPESPIWGFNGTFPGPTVDARYGEPIMLRVENDLPDLTQHNGFGVPQLITHLHNGHTAAESDGGPWNWTDRGDFTDHHYCMARAGFTVPGTIPAQWRDADGGDVRETLTTLFFHYHRPEFTAAGVYKGLLSFFRFFDEKDTGDETLGWRLPSGPYDIPLAFADKRFDPRTGELVFDNFNIDGFLGDKLSVNGKIQPYLEVKRRKYRFRLLNGGPSRFYTFVLRQDGRNQPFHQITDNGNLLEAPRMNITQLELWVAERLDIIVDFSRFQPGSRVYLANILPMKDGRGPDRNSTLNPDKLENRLLEFRIMEDAADPSQVPSYFRPFPPVNLNEVVRKRVWKFERKLGMWAVNGRLWDPDINHTPQELANPRNQIKRNTAEIWELQNASGSWEHPVHIHFEESQLLKINGLAPTQRSRVDIYRLKGNTKIELFLRFRDFPDPDFDVSGQRLGKYSRYVMHCHNTVHEDHAMMATWNVVP